MISLVADRSDEIAALCRRHQVQRLDLFGSAATGDFDPESSDLDFLVTFLPEANATYVSKRSCATSPQCYTLLPSGVLSDTPQAWPRVNDLRRSREVNMNDIDLQRLWGTGTVRVFISHTHTYQASAAILQSSLADLGIASFVAHKDIEPTTQWEAEIIKALQSMHVLVALLTPDFMSSKWTDQEVGAAVGRGIPLFPVGMGLSPYGFMERIQAIPGAANDPSGAGIVSQTIFDSIMGDTRLGFKATELYVSALRGAPRYSRTDTLAASWDRIGTLEDQQVQAILHAYNTNDQVSGAGTFDDIILQLMQERTGVRHQLLATGGRGKRCVPAQEYEGGPRVFTR